MEFTDYVRKPFSVRAIEITDDNLDQVAEFVGTIRTKDDGTRYIEVDRKLVPNLLQVFVGFWMTKIGNNVRCYSPRAFEGQFVKSTPDIANWVEFMNKETEATATVS